MRIPELRIQALTRLGLKLKLAMAFALAVLILICVLWLDGPAAEYFKPRFGDPIHVVASRWTDLGKAELYFIVSALAGLGGWVSARIWQNRRVQMLRYGNWGVQAFLILLFSGFLVQLLKHIFGRKRPYASEALSPHEFHPFTANYEFHSMPSGHSQVMFSVAAILSLVWPRAILVWFMLATLIAASRVITLNHWMSDTIAGAIVGTVGALMARHYLQTTRFKVE